MTQNMFPLSIHKNCELLSLKKKSPKEFEVKIKLTTKDKEYVPYQLPIHGNTTQVAKVLTWLGEEYADEQKFSQTFGYLPSFQFVGDTLYVKNASGNRFPMEMPPMDVRKIATIFRRLIQDKAVQNHGTHSLKKKNGIQFVLKNWSDLNTNRSMSSKNRMAAKVESIHEFVKKTGLAQGIEEDKLDEAHRSLETIEDPVTLLSRYRLHYFSDSIGNELLELEKSSELSSHLRTITN